MDRKVNFYWAGRLMFNIKGNLKAFYSLDYYNEIYLSMSVLIILSPLTAFPKVANEFVIEFFPFCVGYSGILSSFWNMKQIFLSDLRQRIFSSSMCSPLRQIFSTLVIKIRIIPLNDWSCLRYFTNTYIVCVSSIQWKRFKLDHLIFAPPLRLKVTP